MEPSFVFSPPLVKGLRAKQLHHTATRSWVYNNDKRIVPPGGKRFYTLETENCVAVGAVGGAFSGRRAWGTRSIQTNGRKQGGAQRGSSNRKQLHEILMAYIYWQATVSSNSHRGPQGEGGGRLGFLVLTDSPWVKRRTWHTHTDTEIHSHTGLWKYERSRTWTTVSYLHLWECEFREWQQCVDLWDVWNADVIKRLGINPIFNLIYRLKCHLN